MVTIFQYIQPEDAHVLGQAELVVIDEAAAIPLPLVRNLIGPYLVFMASTINGYEGTGRSLSLKLIQQLRDSTRPALAKDLTTTNSKDDDTTVSSSSSKKTLTKAPPKTRTLRELQLSTPIRYSADDKVEKWLNSLLCLDASIIPKSLGMHGCPHPSQCELYYVSRDTLFSYHPASELFLQRMMALYVSSHYKNQPNDLQLMSDAPAHHLFVLLPPLKDNGDGETSLPEPLVVVQVALEGNISRNVILEGLGRGLRAGGDMIPWLISQQFQESRFGMLSGARIVRVACHPDYANVSGYSRRTIGIAGSLADEFFRWVMDQEQSKLSIRFIVESTLTSTSLINRSLPILTQLLSTLCVIFPSITPRLTHSLSVRNPSNGETKYQGGKRNATSSPTANRAQTGELGLFGCLLWVDVAIAEVHPLLFT